MSLQKLLKGAESLLACDKALACGESLAARRGAAIQQLETSLCEFREERADRGLCQRILVAVDESEPANWALQMGIHFAKISGAHVALVHVVHGDMALAPVFAMPREDLAQDLRRTGEQLLQQTKSREPVEIQDVTETLLRVGDPAQQIVATARKWDADLIVLGTHGRAGVAHMLIGSTAESVVRNAHCPVLTVGHDPAERALRPHVKLEELAPLVSPQQVVETMEAQPVG
jgi:nucleotide-binding universal stress UspA family protein